MDWVWPVVVYMFCEWGWQCKYSGEVLRWMKSRFVRAFLARRSVGNSFGRSAYSVCDIKTFLVYSQRIPLGEISNRC